MLHFETVLLVAGALLLISVLASKISSRFGVPALLLFIGIGMLAGSEGPGGIYFSDYVLAHHIGIVALVLILFGGGLDTHWDAVRPIVFPGFSLATIGVAITALVVGCFAHAVLHLSLLEGILLGAILSSTDAAAVFGVLRAQALKLRSELTPLLELESGGNDPMAVFLTVALTGLVLDPGSSVAPLVGHLVLELAIGAIGGLLLGRGASWIINRLHLSYDGLYYVFTIGLAFLSYAGVDAIGGNGFLSVYVCGVALGSKPFVHRLALIQFHEGLAWLMQIVMFLSLGLLVFPSQLFAKTHEGLAVAIVLVLIARPLAVFVSLAGTKRFDSRDKLFLSWAGLRGAVPIILSTIPLMQGVASAPFMFNVVFYAVIVSVLVQGASLRWFATMLGVVVEGTEHVVTRRVSSLKFEVRVPPGAQVIGKSVVELGLSHAILLVLITRNGESSIPRGNTVFQAGDIVLVQADDDAAEEVHRIFVGPAQ